VYAPPGTPKNGNMTERVLPMTIKKGDNGHGGIFSYVS